MSIEHRANERKLAAAQFSTFYYFTLPFECFAFFHFSSKRKRKTQSISHVSSYLVPRRAINADRTMHDIARDRRVFVCCDVKVRFIPFIFPPLLVSLMALLCRFSSFLSLCPPPPRITRQPATITLALFFPILLFI